MAKRRGYKLKKLATDLGLKRGARHAFRPMRRPLEPNVVLIDERLRVQQNVFWIGSAIMYAVAGGVPLLAKLAHAINANLAVPEDLLSTGTAVLASLAIALSIFWLYMAKRGAQALPWMNLIVGVGTGIIGISAITSKAYGPDMLSYLLIPATAAAFFMPFKQAAWHLGAIFLIGSYIAVTHSTEPNGHVIALNIMFFMALAVAMLAFARDRIQAGILHNVALAGRDPLTGVANLRKFNERLQTEVDRAERNGTSLTLLMIDLDDFKLVNDVYSYTLGDAVLVASARAMGRVVRGNELLARRGGDEFAVIAVGADAENAEALTERIKHAVRRERLKLCPDVSPEASIGISEWRSGEDPAVLMRRADAALHVSKLMAHSQDPYGDM